MKLIKSLIPLLITFYNPAFAEVIKSDDGLIGLTGKDALYAVENGVVVSSDPEANRRGSFSFALLFDKRLWDCRYSRYEEPNQKALVHCMSDPNSIISSAK